MKKIALWLLMLCPAALFAQTGKVYDNLTLTSKILKSERKYAVYLPPDYETSGRNYPVLYLLHGAGDDQTGWVQFGEVLNITDKAIRDGIATPMIIIMPDANTGRRGYNNDIKGDWNYEDFFFTELVPFVEKKYRIKGEKRFRAIAGLSMGGGGSFVYALHHPEMFSSACPLSAATGFLSLEDAKAGIGKNNPGMADSTISNYYNRYSVLPLINAIPDDQKKAIRWFMDVGDDDFLYEGNGLVHNLMRKKEIPHEYRVRDGAHNWTYWRGSLPVVLEFVSQAFHQY
ncbi:esterase family protein [Mucilaginibacter sp. 14171R-50]|uniref:alpha/beta hydrolase n=1 Tax=Mucilaginibacter sp. 14171R-50 TaxID=2703789 RepID=UPI00138CC6F8|nr:alpha/beta hydrolase-fold protein [Mucilaginibacter sp. 14171R-50]QHS55704.1 esterase family protein [Mucilaginibacter sp. 14171R-50]